jgi:hypothetical protein
MGKKVGEMDFYEAIKKCEMQWFMHRTMIDNWERTSFNELNLNSNILSICNFFLIFPLPPFICSSISTESFIYF